MKITFASLETVKQNIRLYYHFMLLKLNKEFLEEERSIKLEALRSQKRNA